MTEPFVDQIVRWLTANPGPHTPRAVADATGVSSSKAAYTLRYLAERGRIKRQRSRTIRNGPGASHYSI